MSTKNLSYRISIKVRFSTKFRQNIVFLPHFDQSSFFTKFRSKILFQKLILVSNFDQKPFHVEFRTKYVRAKKNLPAKFRPKIGFMIISTKTHFLVESRSKIFFLPNFNQKYFSFQISTIPNFSEKSFSCHLSTKAPFSSKFDKNLFFCQISSKTRFLVEFRSKILFTDNFRLNLILLSNFNQNSFYRISDQSSFS